MRKATRRAALVGLAASVAAIGTCSASAATEETDPVLEAWRQWRPLEARLNELRMAKEQIMVALPDWAQRPRVKVGEWTSDGCGAKKGDPIYFHSWDQLAAHYGPGSMSFSGMDGPAFFLQKRAEFHASERAMETARERVGLNDIEDRMEVTEKAADVYLRAMLHTEQPGPVALAARLDVAINFSGAKFLVDYPTNILCAGIRDLLPELPADMQEALRPIATALGTMRTIREAYLPMGGSHV
ncbi:hypothetical protein [Hypericibacter sp.]|uniref:hypothetical protein n=1 Tax=Hypericibacter sp. TaxID=2705401 RepID=UPI003D6D2B70